MVRSALMSVRLLIGSPRLTGEGSIRSVSQDASTSCERDEMGWSESIASRANFPPETQPEVSAIEINLISFREAKVPWLDGSEGKKLKPRDDPTDSL